MKNIHKIHVGSFWLFLTTFSSILAMQIFRLIPPFVRIFCSITFLLCKVDVLLFDICVYCVSFCLHVSEIHRLIVVIMAEIIWSRGRPVELLLDVHQILLDVQQDSTGCTLEFCKFALNFSDLPISQRNVIKNFTGCLVEFLLNVLQNLLDVQQNQVLHSDTLSWIYYIISIFSGF